MEESGSEGLDDLVFSLKDTFLKVNYLYTICLSVSVSVEEYGLLFLMQT